MPQRHHNTSDAEIARAALATFNELSAHVVRMGKNPKAWASYWPAMLWMKKLTTLLQILYVRNAPEKELKPGPEAYLRVMRHRAPFKGL